MDPFYPEIAENDMKMMYRCNTIVAFSLKTISFFMRTYSCGRGVISEARMEVTKNRFQEICTKSFSFWLVPKFSKTSIFYENFETILVSLPFQFCSPRAGGHYPHPV